MTRRALFFAIAMSFLFAALGTLAQGDVTTFTADYEGGSLSLAHARVQVRVTPDAVILEQGQSQVSVPLSHITWVAYSDPADTSYLAGMEWSRPSGQVVLGISRRDYGKITAALKKAFEKAAQARATKDPTYWALLV